MILWKCDVTLPHLHTLGLQELPSLPCRTGILKALTSDMMAFPEDALMHALPPGFLFAFWGWVGYTSLGTESHVLMEVSHIQVTPSRPAQHQPRT